MKRQYTHENSMHMKQAHASTGVITQYGVSIFGAWVQNNTKHGRPGGCIVWEGSKYSKHRTGGKKEEIPGSGYSKKFKKCGRVFQCSSSVIYLR